MRMRKIKKTVVEKKEIDLVNRNIKKLLFFTIREKKNSCKRGKRNKLIKDDDKKIQRSKMSEIKMKR